MPACRQRRIYETITDRVVLQNEAREKSCEMPWTKSRGNIGPPLRINGQLSIMIPSSKLIVCRKHDEVDILTASRFKCVAGEEMDIGSFGIYVTIDLPVGI